ncbi:hypothetical protein DVH24_003307 [Malus domestica]|uniref:Uncharacterized protein n=1 Tax=Malus domestica TaxID=3750 RepID=A0A498II69_MALDO|nr:hypothetical protein DVH24_003307 [Malus domestica]
MAGPSGFLESRYTSRVVLSFFCQKSTCRLVIIFGSTVINFLTHISHQLYSDTWCTILYTDHTEKSLTVKREAQRKANR